MNFRIIIKNLAADPKIGFLTKSISKPFGRATAMPTAWKLRYKNNLENNSTFPSAVTSVEVDPSI